MTVERIGNDYRTTITATINAAVTSLTVLSATGIPTAPFRIRIDSEIMVVTNVGGTTLTVQRGKEGTTAASHTSGTTLYAVATAAYLETHDPGYNRLPRHHNLKGWTFPHFMLGTSSDTYLFNTKRMALHRIFTPESFTLTKLWWLHRTTAVSTTGSAYGVIYNSSGTLIGKTAELVAGGLIPSVAGVGSAPVTAEAGQSLTFTGAPDNYLMAGMLVVTPGNLTLGRASAADSSGFCNIGLTAGTDVLNHCVKGTDDTTPPATVNFLSDFGPENQMGFFAVSGTTIYP